MKLNTCTCNNYKSDILVKVEKPCLTSRIKCQFIINTTADVMIVTRKWSNLIITQIKNNNDIFLKLCL